MHKEYVKGYMSRDDMDEDNSSQIISVRALWGNDDAESTISLTSEQWDSIRNGGCHVEISFSSYEGEHEEVTWTFADGLVTIDGDGGGQYLIDSPICELYISTST